MTRLLIVALFLAWSSIATADGPLAFTRDRITLSRTSPAMLDQVAAALVADPTITLVEIQVHTDAQGSDEYNLKMSQQRAQAIQAHLVSKGVDAARLRAKGYGETKPLDKGTSAKARAKNRRTEFVILKRS